MTNTAQSYLKRLCSNYPELIGRQLYLSPRWFDGEICCMLNSDATLTIVGGTEESFSTPLELICKVYDPNWKRASSAKDLFMQTGRKMSLDAFIKGLNKNAAAPVTVKPGKKKKCDGFKLRPFSGYVATSKYTEVQLDDGVYRSVGCTGVQFRRCRRKTCAKCSVAQEAVTNYLLSLRHRGLLCCGIRRAKFDALIRAKEWEGNRADVSPAIFFGPRLFARQCDGSKVDSRSHIRCDHCSRLNATLRTARLRLSRQKPSYAESRLLCSRKCTLSALDLEQKEKLLQRRRKDKMRKLQAAAARPPLAKIRARRFVPRHQSNRVAAQSVVRVKMKDMDTNPICLWSIENGQQCGHRAETCTRLLAHLNNTHVGAQECHIWELALGERRYTCQWAGCTRCRTSF